MTGTGEHKEHKTETLLKLNLSFSFAALVTVVTWIIWGTHDYTIVHSMIDDHQRAIYGGSDEKGLRSDMKSVDGRLNAIDNRLNLMEGQRQWELANPAPGSLLRHR